MRSTWRRVSAEGEEKEGGVGGGGVAAAAEGGLLWPGESSMAVREQGRGRTVRLCGSGGVWWLRWWHGAEDKTLREIREKEIESEKSRKSVRKRERE